MRSFSMTFQAFPLYADFHAEIAKKIVSMSGELLLIDCHSFSSLPNMLCSNPPDIDICIGYNDDETHPIEVAIGNIVQYFKSLGYKVGINKPFSNSKTFNVPVEYHTVMIEVNKRLYMNEQTLEKSDSFYKLKHDIQSLYDVLLKR
jgi:N-formylglutamate amidohydrolase